jgi:hypothetical protein
MSSLDPDSREDGALGRRKSETETPRKRGFSLLPTWGLDRHSQFSILNSQFFSLAPLSHREGFVGEPVFPGERRSGAPSEVVLEFLLKPLGRRRWAIPEGYIPAESHGPAPEMTSHEAVCLLNVSDQQAHVSITVFFTDREPAGPYRVAVGPRRTLHLRFNDFEDPEPIPRETDYASLIESDVPIVVQHTRLDSRQPANALLSTIAYAAEE